MQEVKQTIHNREGAVSSIINLARRGNVIRFSRFGADVFVHSCGIKGGREEFSFPEKIWPEVLDYFAEMTGNPTRARDEGMMAKSCELMNPWDHPLVDDPFHGSIIFAWNTERSIELIIVPDLDHHKPPQS